MGNEHSLLKESLAKHIQISDEAFNAIVSRGRERTYKKGQFLVHEGASIRKTHFIKKGAAVAYFIDLQGNEHLIQFATEGWWISDIGSYIAGKPALLSVQAFENCELYEFSYDEMQLAFKEVPELESYFLIITQKAFATFQERVLNNLSQSAEERYRSFVERYPDFERRFPQKWLASYIGVSAEFLSKIKKRLT